MTRIAATPAGLLPLLAFVVVSAVVLLLPVGRGPLQGLFWFATWDLGHVALGIGFAFVILNLAAVAAWPVSRRWILVLLVTLTLAVVFEGLQRLVGRTASVKDVVSTVAGSLLWLLLRCRPWPVSGRARQGLILCLGLLLVVPLAPLGWAVYVRSSAALSFPVLADFSNLACLGQWHHESVRRVAHPEVPSAHALRMTIPAVAAEQRVGRHHVLHFDGFPADWSAYDDLLLELYAESEVRVHLSVADEHYRRRQTYDRSDRFGVVLELRPGVNRFRFMAKSWLATSGGRQMDARDIRQVSFIVRALPERSQSFIVSRIELVRPGSHVGADS